MPLLLLAAFIGVPLIEIAVFIQVGGVIGLWPTLGLVLLSAVIGSWQLRSQGLATLSRARAQLDAGQVPARELFDGLCLLFAGALLLTPGFVTDSVGILLFIPAVRDWLRNWAARHIVAGASARVFVDGEEIRPRGGRGGGSRDHGPGVIDAEYEDVTPADATRGDDDALTDDRWGSGRR